MAFGLEPTGFITADAHGSKRRHEWEKKDAELTPLGNHDSESFLTIRYICDICAVVPKWT